MSTTAMSEGDVTRPSARAVARLASGVQAEVTDLRGRLQLALDEAGRLEAVGRQDLAVAVLEDQREALVEAHHRLQGQLAEAAVEREAEGVVQAAVAELTPAEVPQRMALRLLAAAVAGVLGLVMLIVPEFDAGSLAAAGEPLDDAAGRGDRTPLEFIELQVIPPAMPSPPEHRGHPDGDARRR